MGATIHTRVGQGEDVHRLEAGRPLLVGCVVIDSPCGAVGHSDGDVLAHAVCDAIFGALAAGDIGSHFPPSEERWRGADSRIFLTHAARLLRSKGGRVVNLDATVTLEAPRLAPYMGEIRRTLGRLLGCPESAVSVKAKTAEGLGAIGGGEAIAARAVVLVELER